MSEFDSIEEELKFMADCSDDRGDSETSLMFVRYLAHIRKLNAELAALRAGQGEAVATYMGMDWAAQHQFLAQCADLELGTDLYTAPPATADCEFHGSDKAACEQYSGRNPCATADAVSVPVELLERIADHLEWDGSEPMTTVQFAYKCDGLAEELRALLAQAKP